jgi:hypothetical protein
MFLKGKIMRTASLLLSAALVAGCASWGKPPVSAGDSESQVIAKLGAPAHRYQTGNELLLEYPRGPWGQATYMARIGPDGRLLRYEQVLSTEKFASIVVNQASKQDVLHTVGAPHDTSYFPRRDLEVWSYPYKEGNVWNSVMHVHFDRKGIVREMQNGPDWRFERDPQWPFGR